jgi:hypothetical protein
MKKVLVLAGVGLAAYVAYGLYTGQIKIKKGCGCGCNSCHEESDIEAIKAPVTATILPATIDQPVVRNYDAKPQSFFKTHLGDKTFGAAFQTESSDKEVSQLQSITLN